MKEKLEEILIKVKEKLKSINDEKALNNLRSLTLGKKSEISSLMANFRDLPVEDRKEYGKLINEQKQVLEELFEVKRNQILAEKLKEKLAKEEIDVTIPEAKLPLGSSHILNQVIKDFERLLLGWVMKLKMGLR